MPQETTKGGITGAGHAPPLTASTRASGSDGTLDTGAPRPAGPGSDEAGLTPDHAQSGHTGQDAARQRADAARRRMGEVGDRLREQATRAGDVGKKRAVSTLRSLGASVAPTDDAPEAARDGQNRLSDGLNGAADYIEGCDLSEIGRDATALARNHPIAVVGTLAMIGFAAGRVLSVRAPTASDEGSEPGDGRPDADAHSSEFTRPTSFFGETGATGGPVLTGAAANKEASHATR